MKKDFRVFLTEVLVITGTLKKCKVALIGFLIIVISVNV